MKKLPPLKIGHLKIDPPFILGGMGVRITNHKIVAAVANLGMAGTIASVGLCERNCDRDKYVSESNYALAQEIRKAKELSKGIIGVNVMVALTNYNELVTTAIQEKADYIISGAGLPLSLPELAKGKKVCLIPIVSSARAANIICKKWLKKYNRLPDAIVVEGALAGGHLGFKFSDIFKGENKNLKTLCREVILVCKKYERESKRKIPVIAAGGIFDGKDIAKFLKIGVAGVQMATRFIATNECSVPQNFKKAIVDSKQEDMALIASPVGLPGRALKNKFVRKLLNGEKFKVDCPYHCLKTCDPETTPFCIADVLVKAHEGDVENGLIMAGYNAYKVKNIISVKELIDNLVKQTLENL